MAKSLMEEIISDALSNVAWDITTIREIDFMFKHIKPDFIIKMLAEKLESYGVKLP